MIARLATTDLERLADQLDGHACSLEDDCPDCRTQRKVERELERRELWDADDARVRESVGNYR